MPEGSAPSEERDDALGPRGLGVDAENVVERVTLGISQPQGEQRLLAIVAGQKNKVLDTSHSKLVPVNYGGRRRRPSHARTGYDA